MDFLACLGRFFILSEWPETFCILIVQLRVTKKLFSWMSPDVCLKVTTSRAGVVLLRATERFFSRMTSHVSCEVIAIYAGVSQVHCEQLKFFSSDWVCLCRVRLPLCFVENSHCVQAKGLSPLCTCKCFWGFVTNCLWSCIGCNCRASLQHSKVFWSYWQNFFVSEDPHSYSHCRRITETKGVPANNASESFCDAKLLEPEIVRTSLGPQLKLGSLQNYKCDIYCRNGNLSSM